MFIRSTLVVTALAFAGSMFAVATTTQPAYSFGSAPAPKPCVKFKRGTRSWKRCRRRNKLPTSATQQTEEILTLGYTLATSGQYDKALKFLRTVEHSNDPRVLTYIGFSERKLGNVDVAMEYYRRSLAIDPQNVSTLSYMGEAHLQHGDVTAARDKLQQVASLCGSQCEQYKALDLAIISHIAKI